MRRFALIVVGLLLVAVAFALPAFPARAALFSRFEYMRLTPGLPTQDPSTGNPLAGVSPNRQGYMACVAGRPATEKCREFEDPELQSRAESAALATLGNEGWELVSVVEDTLNQSPRGLSYIFKRELR